MSFAIFDPLFALLSEEIDVPVAKLKKAWDNCLVKFFKTDPNVQARIAPKLQQAKKPIVEQEEILLETGQPIAEPPKKSTAKKQTKAKEDPLPQNDVATKPKKAEKPSSSKTEPIKLPNCDESGCTIKVKLARPIDGKNFCSKHYQKHSKALSKKEEEPSKKIEIVPAVESSESESEEDIVSEKEPEVEPDESASDHEEQLESESESDDEDILQTLKQGFDGYFKQPVTAQNLTRVGTMEQYLVFFRNNWHNFQKVYEQLVDADQLQLLIQKKKVQKADLFMLFEKINPKLIVS